MIAQFSPVVAVLMLSAPAFALSASADEGNCQGECNQPPRQISFSYDEAAGYFASGSAPTPDQALGNWIEVGSAELPAFNPIDAGKLSMYDPEGIKNPDGSFRRVLSFVQAPRFDGTTEDIVTLYNLGQRDLNQGPNEVSFSPYGACFAQWAYQSDSATVIDQGAHFNYECRLVNQNTKKMICALIYHIDSFGAHTLPGEDAFDGQTVYYSGFIARY